MISAKMMQTMKTIWNSFLAKASFHWYEGFIKMEMGILGDDIDIVDIFSRENIDILNDTDKNYCRIETTGG